MNSFRLFIFALAALVSTAVFAREECHWGSFPYKDQVPFTAKSPASACSALVSYLNAQYDGVSGYKPMVYDHYELETDAAGSGSSAPGGGTLKRRARCYMTHPDTPGPQYIGTVDEICKTTDQACESGKTKSFTFDWLKNKSDEYDLRKAPSNIGIDGCEYKRQDSSIRFGEKGSCKWPAIIEYKSTGDEREEPAMDDVPEKCTGDDGGGDEGEGEVTPGNFPNIKGLYERKYKDGIAGVLESLQRKIQDTDIWNLVTILTTPPPGIAGDCSNVWQLDLNLGGPMGLNMGIHNIEIPCSIKTAMRAIVILSAIVAARGIIFGG